MTQPDEMIPLTKSAAAENHEDAKAQASHMGIFWTFFRVGLLTLGGGLAMATVLRHELVLKRRWIPDDDFMAELSTATLVPGAIAVNMAYLQGRRLRGSTGAAVAICGTILPSFCIILLIAGFAWPYLNQPKVAAFFRGCALAVVGQLAFAGFAFGRRRLRDWRNVAVCSVGVIVVAFFGMHPIWAVVVAGGLGYFLCPNSRPPSQANRPD